MKPLARVSHGAGPPYPENRTAFQPAPGEVEPGLRVRVGLVPRDQAVLDLEVDDRGRRLSVGALLERLEVEVAEDGPLEIRRDRELQPSLDVDRIAEVRDQLRHGHLDGMAADPDGRKMIAGAVVGQVLGNMVIRKIINIQV